MICTKYGTSDFMTPMLIFALCHAQPPRIQVKVDPRVELLTAVFRLQGAWEYNMPSSEGPYSKRLDAYLKPFRDHKFIKKTTEYREKHRIGFDAVPWLAVHIDGIKNPKMKPGAHIEDWDARWPKKEMSDYLKQLGKFAQDVKFEDFLKSEQGYITHATKSLQELLDRKPIAKWLNDFFGAPPSASSYAIVGLLCGGGNYGMSFRNANEEVIATPILGAGEFNKDGYPVYGESSLGLVLHEFSHPYVNHIVAKFPDVDRYGETLFELTRSALNANSYHGGRTTMAETFTRAAENIMLRRWEPTLVQSNMITHRSKGFLWQSDVVDALEAASRPGRSFKDRIPEVIPVLEKLAKDPQKLLQRCPNVVRFEVSKADENGVSKLRIGFDQKMNPRGHGINIQPSEYEVVGQPSFDDAGKTAEISFRLKKGVAYEFELNPSGGGYTSEAGYPLQPIKKTAKVE